MQRPQRKTVTLEDIIITEELSRRNPRAANLLAENQALQALARQLVNQPQTMLQSLVDIALELCSAETVGVSLLEITAKGEEIFRWNVLAGELAEYVGGTTPRNFSPCGVCLDRGTPQLYAYPERYFTYLQAANTPIVEGLVLPLIADNHALGTIWIMSHDEQRHFDSEDVRVMTSLADLAAAALLLNQRQTQELLAKNAQLEAEAAERQRAEELARGSEAYFRAMMENLPGGAVFVVDRNLRYLLAEGEALHTAGFKSADLVGKTIFEALSPELAVNYEVNYRRALAGEPFEHEHDAHDRSFLSRGTPLRLPNGEVYAVLVVSYDISDRKLAEANLTFLAEISQDLARLTNIDETMNALGEKIGGYFNLSACVFAELSETAEIAVIDYTWQLSHMPSFIGTYRMQDFVTPEVLQLCRAGEAVVIRDVFDDPLVDGEQYAALNIRSFLSIPLVRDGEWRFLLVIYHTEPYDWRDDEIELTHELANRIWTRLERARAEAAVEADLRDTQMLHNLATRLIGEGDIQALYQEIVKTAIALTQADAGSFQFLDETTQELVIMATQGIDRTMAEHFHRLDASSNTSCGIALATGERTFINFDVPESEDPDGSQRMHKDAGLRCAQSTPLRSRSGKPIGMVSTHWREDRQLSDRELRFLDLLARQAADIIEQRQAEENRIQLIHEQAAREQERQRAETLAELDRAKTLFFSNVSHEFRTPLTLLLAPLQDTLSERTHPLPQEQRDRLELAQRNAMRLLKLVNTLLDFSRIEARRMEAVYEPTDLARFTTELASVFRSAIERAGLQLIVDCPPISAPVYVDREMWEKIVLNLLSNAFKFTLEGEIAIRLHLADGDRVTLQVEDTGTGIEPEQLPHVFERFYQVRGVQARTHEGSGIGLALVQELIKLHGGTVEVSSTLGVGSCFTVTIPLGTAHLPSEPIQATRTISSTALGATPYVQEAERWIGEDEGDKGEGGANSSLSPLSLPSAARVLIIDDNADMRDYLTRILSDRVEVQAVADGAAALATLNGRMPDLVLSDVMMPGLDGFELLKALRADPRTKEIPIILLSARAEEESVIEGLQAGADDYLIKPFSATELVTRVNAYLQMAHLRSEALHQERIINHKKDEVLSTVSHELNTPLVAILGWTRLLRSSQPSPAMLMKALETIERNATLQAKLVQDLLDISRITAGKIHLNLEPVELQAVIENAIATVRQSETKDIRLDCLLDPLPTIVQGDPERLQQIILNLLTNAVKFTPESGRIEVSLQTQENQAQIIVSDTGCGIDSDLLPYIFDTFRQADGVKKGLGLGLAIARQLVELHGGTIHAHSPGIGQGATFTVKLPLIRFTNSN
ncbi:ATP-binding protein [Calothrix sp. NIES-2098]|uniref:ATP-binding protein n=1 Tax=Calothrix sp. NIES-2098 TaxID=1954171 RepID=UPI000B5E9E73|nr:multi-sensor signal transduction histidine kinase [Calothrix sp. NIES-2098]